MKFGKGPGSLKDYCYSIERHWGGGQRQERSAHLRRGNNYGARNDGGVMRSVPSQCTKVWKGAIQIGRRKTGATHWPINWRIRLALRTSAHAYIQTHNSTILDNGCWGCQHFIEGFQEAALLRDAFFKPHTNHSIWGFRFINDDDDADISIKWTTTTTKVSLHSTCFVEFWVFTCKNSRIGRE